MKLVCTTVFTLAITTASFAEIFQYEDCDGDGSLFLTELDAEPGVDLIGLYLGCADLQGENLNEAELSDCDLNNADLQNAALNQANLTNANLTNANMNGASLFETSFIEANLTNVILTSVFMMDSNLTNANLTGVDMTGAKMYGPILTGANVSGANLYAVSGWSDATWTGATYNDDTIFPDGMNPEKYGMIYLSDTGACCVTSGCDVVEENMCINFGGTWTEAGSCDDCVAPPETCDGDMNADGVVNIDDLLLLISYFGNTCP